MRAKRSKKYRKIMDSYNLHFSFREPYQVLCDSNFLRGTHAFKMPIQKFLDNTLHGQTRPYITQCSLAKIEADSAKAKKNGSEGLRGDGKPEFLPPPTEVPLRYCKHKDDSGQERGAIDEAECLAELVSGQIKGNQEKKNNKHYVLATADFDEGMRKQNHTTVKKPRGPDLREQARTVPGVPIIYVKRSVMILEEMSTASERTIRGTEKDKLKEGLVGELKGTKRQRDNQEDDSASDNDETEGVTKVRRTKGPKGPNPLSVKKKKPKVQQLTAPVPGKQDEAEIQKKKNRRKRGKKAGNENSTTVVDVAATSATPDVMVET